MHVDPHLVTTVYTTAAYLSPSLDEVLVVLRINCDLHLHDIVLRRNHEMVMMNKLKEWGKYKVRQEKEVEM